MTCGCHSSPSQVCTRLSAPPDVCLVASLPLATAAVSPSCSESHVASDAQPASANATFDTAGLESQILALKMSIDQALLVHVRKLFLLSPFVLVHFATSHTPMPVSLLLLSHMHIFFSHVHVYVCPYHVAAHSLQTSQSRALQHEHGGKQQQPEIHFRKGLWRRRRCAR